MNWSHFVSLLNFVTFPSFSSNSLDDEGFHSLLVGESNLAHRERRLLIVAGFGFPAFDPFLSSSSISSF